MSFVNDDKEEGINVVSFNKNINNENLKPLNFLFDSAARVNTANDDVLNALYDIDSTNDKLRGITGNVEAFDGIGTHPLVGRTMIYKLAPTSVASQSVLSTLYHIHYDDAHHVYRLWDKSTGVLRMIAIEVDNLFPLLEVLDPSLEEYHMWNEVYGNLASMDVHSEDEHNASFELHRTLNHTSKVKFLIENGHMHDIGGEVFQPYDHLHCSVCALEKDYRGKSTINGKNYKTGLKRAKYVKDDQEPDSRFCTRFETRV